MTEFPLTYIESDKILQNTTPPRALKPQPPNSPERWALMCSVMLYLFRLIRLIVFLLLIIKMKILHRLTLAEKNCALEEQFPIDLHWLRKIAPLEEQFPSGGAEWLDQFHF